MPTEERVTLSDDDAAFVQEHDLNLDELMAQAVAAERQTFKYNNPTPEISDEAKQDLAAVVANVRGGRYEGATTVSRPVASRAALALHCSRVENVLRMTATISQFQEVTGIDEPGETLQESGEFCQRLHDNLAEFLSDQLPSLSPADVRLECDEVDERIEDIRVDFEGQIPLETLDTATITPE